MRFSDINKMFSDKVSEYLAKGYIINVSSMGGSQGEIGKVDLVKGEELIRIWINSELSHNWLDDNSYHKDHVVVRVSRWNRKASESFNCTVWISELDNIEEYTFYEIKRDKWYTDDLNEALTIQNKHNKRLVEYKRYPSESTLMNSNYNKIGVNYLKRKIGYQRVDSSKVFFMKDIYYNRNQVKYSLHYNGNSYVLN